MGLTADEIEPTEMHYYLKCKVSIKEVWVEDIKKDGPVSVKRNMCYLLPETTTQGMMFFKAWLPETEFDSKGQLAYFELASIISNPVAGPCRVAIGRANEKCPEGHHLYVMSMGVEDELVKAKYDGKVVQVEVLPESHEYMAEKSKDTDRPITAYDL